MNLRLGFLCLRLTASATGWGASFRKKHPGDSFSLGLMYCMRHIFFESKEGLEEGHSAVSKAGFFSITIIKRW